MDNIILIHNLAVMIDRNEVIGSIFQNQISNAEKLRQIHWIVFNAAANIQEARSILGVTEEEYYSLLNESDSE